MGSTRQESFLHWGFASSLIHNPAQFVLNLFPLLLTRTVKKISPGWTKDKCSFWKLESDSNNFVSISGMSLPIWAMSTELLTVVTSCLDALMNLVHSQREAMALTSSNIFSCVPSLSWYWKQPVASQGLHRDTYILPSGSWVTPHGSNLPSLFHSTSQD